MAIEPHIHEYALRVKIVQEGATHRAVCSHPECDHSIDASEIIDRINSIERFMAMADEAQREVNF